ncbi:MAG: hypothetical protein ACOVSW_19335 [Candidatus Kapaibacteriota bacterium]
MRITKYELRRWLPTRTATTQKNQAGGLSTRFPATIVIPNS